MAAKVVDIYVAERMKKAKTMSEESTEPTNDLTTCVGFPSPAQNYMEKALSLDEHFMKHPSATYYVRVVGESLVGVGIQSEDILIVDRALEPKPNRIVMAVVGGEFVIRRVCRVEGALSLVSVHDDNRATGLSGQAAFSAGNEKPTGRTEFEIWGVVTNVIHPV